MYNDGGVTDNLFTGYYDSVAQEYVYPDAHQNFVIRFTDFYLSADDGDFTTDGVTIASEVCDVEDITVGNASAKVLTATMLNPDGLMDSLTWGDGAAYIGVVTATEDVDLSSYPGKAFVSTTSRIYRMYNGKAYAGAAEASISGNPISIVVANDGKAWFYTDTGAYYYNLSTITLSTPDPFAADKATKKDGVGILLDANGLPSTTWAITDDIGNAGTKTTTAYIPMGIFDFSSVDAYGITFGVEAYDQMTLFDADATEWFSNIDFESPPTKSVNWIVSEIMLSQLGNVHYYSSIDLVNGTLSWSKNPIPAYSLTYRQILKWMCELQGGNLIVRRDGTPEIRSFNPHGSAMTITPDTVVSNTRTTARYSTAPISEVKCFDMFGQLYTAGTPGSTYYIVGNPFIDPSNDVTPLSNLCTLLSSDIPGHYPTSLVVTCFDPRVDAGDFVTIQRPDRLSSYKIPVMHLTLKWNGICTASISATGNQVRAIPSSLTAIDLASQVNSNPAARTIMWEVETPSTVVPSQNDKETLDISTGQIITSETTWDDLGSGSFTYEKTSLMQHGELELSIDTTNDPDGGKRSTTTLIGGSAIFQNEKDGYPDPGGTLQQVMIDPEYPHAIQVSSGTVDSGGTLVDNSVWIGADDIQLTKGNYTKTITADGPTINGDNSSSNVSVPSGTVTELTSFTIDPGVYLLTATARFASNSSGNRQFCVRSGSTASIDTNLSREFQVRTGAANGVTTCLCVSAPQLFTSTTTVHLYAQQSSGSSLGVAWAYHYVRLA